MTRAAGAAIAATRIAMDILHLCDPLMDENRVEDSARLSKFAAALSDLTSMAVSAKIGKKSPDDVRAAHARLQRNWDKLGLAVQLIVSERAGVTGYADLLANLVALPDLEATPAIRHREPMF